MSEPCRVITEEQYRDYLRLKKKLDIAVKELKEYGSEENWNNCETENGWKLWFGSMFLDDHYGYRKAKDALEEIEELK